MKLNLLLLFFPIILNAQIDYTEYDYRLEKIARNFRENISDESQNEQHKNEASELADEIHSAYLETNNQYIEKQLKEYERKARGLEDYISAVGYVGNYHPHKNEFYEANNRVGGLITHLTGKKFCIDIISVKVGNNITYLFENNTNANLRVSYTFSTKNSTSKGELGVMKDDLNHFHTTQNDVSEKIISITSVKCLPFELYKF